MKAKIAILLGSLVLLAAACNSRTEVTTNNPPPPPPPASVQPNPPPPPPAATGDATINMTSAGFEPSTVTVKAGSKVTFVNKDTVPRWPASAPHPTHTDLPGFDALKGVAVGGNYSFTFTKVGTWKFHDHLIPTKFGSVVVVE